MNADELGSRDRGSVGAKGPPLVIVSRSRLLGDLGQLRTPDLLTRARTMTVRSARHIRGALSACPFRVALPRRRGGISA